MADPVRVRRDVWQLSADEIWHPVLLAYARGVGEMRKRPATAPTSWAYQGAIHGTDAAVPRGAPWNQCRHGGWYFLPWHRLYLFFFEGIVRASLPAAARRDWALPYWSVESPGGASLPPAFRERTLPDGKPNPLFVNERAPGVNTGGRLPAAQLSSSAAMAATTFAPPPGAGFGGGRTGPAQFSSAYGEVERTPHNDVHVIVGGTGLMGDPNRAALDPIFWLHHANIDRLWSEWLVLGGGRADPTDAAWRRQRFSFVDEQGTRVQRTVRQSLDLRELGYTYDTLPTDHELVAAAPAPRRRPAATSRSEADMELIGASDPVELTGGATVTSVTIDARAAADARGRESVGAQRLYLALEDIEGEANPGTVYEVHVVGGKGRRRRTSADRYVGNVSFFGIERSRRSDDAHAMRHVYDVTEVLDRLRESADWSDGDLRVEFRPLALELDDAAGDDEGAAELPASPPPVRIGRVSLFVE